MSGIIQVLENPPAIVSDPAEPYDCEARTDVGTDVADLLAYTVENDVIPEPLTDISDWKAVEWDRILAIVMFGATRAPWIQTGINSKTDLSDRPLVWLEDTVTGGVVVCDSPDDEYDVALDISDLSPNTQYRAVRAGRTFAMLISHLGHVDFVGELTSRITPIASPIDGACSTDSLSYLVLLDDGTVVCDGATTLPNPMVSSAPIVAVGMGDAFGFLLHSDGYLDVFGSLPQNSALGDVLFNSDWQGRFCQVAAGGNHIVALLTDGTIVAWGRNTNKQCDVPAFSSYATESQPEGLTGHIESVAADRYRSYATVDFGIGVIYWGLITGDSDYIIADREGGIQLTGQHNRAYVGNGYALHANFNVDPIAFERQGNISPNNSAYATLTFDVSRSTVVKFGGNTLSVDPVTLVSTLNSRRLNAIWEFGPGVDRWQERVASVMPVARQCHASVYDSVRHLVMVIGGCDASGTIPFAGAAPILNFAEWDGTTWTLKTFSGSGPSATISSAAVFDPNRGDADGRTIVFSGFNGSINAYSALNRQYKSSTDTWSNLGLTGMTNSSRGGAACCYDDANDVTVLFGGWNYTGSSGGFISDGTGASAGAPATYTLASASTTWSKLSPASPPASRAFARMTFNSTNGKCYLFGGALAAGGNSNELWEWDTAAGTWTLLTPTHKPSARYGVALCYDPVNNRLVLFGGINGVGQLRDTWAYDFGSGDWEQIVTDPSPTGTLTMPANMVIREAACGEGFTLALADYVWGCGNLSQMVISLLQANGHRARPISGFNSATCGGDTVLEVYSTYYQKWIMIFSQHAGYIANAQGVPLSYAEVKAAHDAGDYTLEVSYSPGLPGRGVKGVAANGSGLQFLPRPECTVPAPPYATTSHWWSSKLFTLSPEDNDTLDWAKTSNIVKYGSDPQVIESLSIGDDSLVDECGWYTVLTHYEPDDPDISYPLNSIHAEVTLTQPNKVHIVLTENITDDPDGFDTFEFSTDGGETWDDIDELESEGDGYNWYPTEPATIRIRGVSNIGIQSPDVVIRYAESELPMAGVSSRLLLGMP